MNHLKESAFNWAVAIGFGLLLGYFAARGIA
jgi:hypothetical protein